MLPDAKIPDGPMADKWDNHRFDIKLVNPANKRKFKVIVVGTGLAGASAAAYFGAYAGEGFVSELFDEGVPLVAGQFAPNGQGRPVEGGYRLTGSYQFGSGLSYAEWVGAGFLVPAAEGSDAPARYLFGLVPRTGIETLRTGTSPI